jgi:hypothetical protein
MPDTMTLHKAIQTLSADLRNRHPYTNPDVNTALKLAIEALEAIRFKRANPQVLSILSLTSEAPPS